ncbi:MAG: VRR-NUC domain-containing protein [Burkholderiaceae bacterium]|nr:VRR-NUC domain-containing protein [Burkholderiaceae bacterium]
MDISTPDIATPPVVGPRLEPVLSSKLGSRDFQRMAGMGLPPAWIDRHRKSPGYWIAPDEYFWTPDAYFMALEGVTKELLRGIRDASSGSFFELPLRSQCELLGADYIAVSPKDADMLRPEPGIRLEQKVMARLREAGWQGECGEGASLALAELAVRRKIEVAGFTYWPVKWLSRMPPEHRQLDQAESNALAQAVAEVTEAEVVTIYVNWKRNPQSVSLSPAAGRHGLAVDDVCACFAAMTEDMLRAKCERSMLGFGVGGWPDLTVARDGELRLIEVKSKRDRFTERQATWFRNYARPLGWRVAVQHVPV